MLLIGWSLCCSLCEEDKDEGGGVWEGDLDLSLPAGGGEVYSGDVSLAETSGVQFWQRISSLSL